jgi:iron complex outermembrane receptor protein
LLFVTPTDPITEKDELTGSEPTGTVRLTYTPTPQSSLYAKYTHGWKSGTFNATGSRRTAVTEAKPEEIDAFEVGLRGSYLDDYLNLTLSLFHYDYENYQLFTSQSNFQAPPEFVILNAPEVELYGSEVEATITTPWEGGMVDVKFAWLEGEFKQFTQTQFTTIQIGAEPLVIVRDIDRSGNRLLNAPRYSVTLSLQQVIPIGRLGTLTPRWDGTWKDTTYFDASEGRGIPNEDGEIFMPQNTIGQSPHWRHNLRLTYRTPNQEIEIAGWVRNLTNETYKTFSADLSTFQRTTLHFVGDKRTYGISTAVKF